MFVFVQCLIHLARREGWVAEHEKGPDEEPHELELHIKNEALDVGSQRAGASLMGTESPPSCLVFSFASGFQAMVDYSLDKALLGNMLHVWTCLLGTGAINGGQKGCMKKSSRLQPHKLGTRCWAAAWTSFLFWQNQSLHRRPNVQSASDRGVQCDEFT